MSMITEQIKALKKHADFMQEMGHLSTARIIRNAADTIEALSEKVRAANMERSTAYYNGGWIPLSEESMIKDELYDFANWVAEEIFDENWEYNKDAFAELACRKLAKLGIVRTKGGKWELVEPQESEDKCKNCEYYHNPDYTRCHECKAESGDKE